MGRRALPKLRADVDYSRLYREATELTEPIEVEKLFGRIGPLHVEVGSGKGLFLASESGCRPKDLFLGIEISRKYAKFAAYRCAQQNRDNVIVVCGDAVRFLATALRDQSADSVHIYFPDPWWKARHRKRRVVQPSLVQAVERVLKPGGKLHFWTDVAEYFETGSETILAHGGLAGPHPVELHDSPEGSYRTHFERRTRLNDKPVYRAEFRKP